MQCDKKVCPDVICNIRTKDMMLPIFQQISQAPPTARSQLKTKYGLEDEPTPLLKLSFDVYRYMYSSGCVNYKNSIPYSYIMYTSWLQKHPNRNSAHYSIGALQIFTSEANV